MPRTDKAKQKEYDHKYYLEHKTEKNAYSKEYNKSDEFKLYLKQYQEAHRAEINSYQNDYNKERRKIDENFRLSHNLRVRLKSAIKNNQKSGNTVELLGCSVSEFKLYLQSKFTPEMSWDNYGSYWEIDHILPCASFDLSNEKDQKTCFHWTNMQPLEKNENRVKSDRMVI